MANGVVGIEPRHGRHVALLEMPYSIVCQDDRNLPRKADGVIKILEHRDRSDHLGLGLGHGRVRSRTEEIWDQPNARRVVACKLPSRWIDAYSRQPAFRIRFQGSGVIASDVENGVAGSQRYEALDLPYLLVEVINHGLVKS